MAKKGLHTFKILTKKFDSIISSGGNVLQKPNSHKNI